MLEILKWLVNDWTNYVLICGLLLCFRPVRIHFS